MSDILLLGRSGQVARALYSRLGDAGHKVITLGRTEADLSDPDVARAAVLGSQPDFVINAAAYTAADRAETEAEAATALNVNGPAAAARAAADLGIPFLQISTDYVFDGSKGAPYTEADDPHPLSVYGRTKWDGERAVAAANPRHVILRTAWVYSSEGANFLRTMLELAKTREFLTIVNDQKGCPTYAGDLADVVASIVGQIEQEDRQTWGVFHAAGGGDATWFEFAEAIMAGSAARGGPSANVVPITSKEFPTVAKRPTDSRLSTEKLSTIFGITLPSWRCSLEACLDEIFVFPR